MTLCVVNLGFVGAIIVGWQFHWIVGVAIAVLVLAYVYALGRLLLVASGAENLKRPVVWLLLTLGAPVNATDKDGETPLHRVARVSTPTAPPIAGLLIARGANVNATDSCAWTPLHTATFAIRRRDMVELLVLRGANVNARNSDGKTALDFAEDPCLKHNEDTVALLRLEVGPTIEIEPGQYFKARGKNVLLVYGECLERESATLVRAKCYSRMCPTGETGDFPIGDILEVITKSVFDGAVARLR